jgi:hypothetical protein
MNDGGYVVAVVLDPTFGDRLGALAEDMPVWVADTPTNRAVAEQIWHDHKGGLRADVTTFRVSQHEAPEDWCKSIIGTVVEHHGEYSHNPPVSVLQIIGAKPTEPLRDALAEYGFTSIDLTPQGFQARAHSR